MIKAEMVDIVPILLQTNQENKCVFTIQMFLRVWL